METSKPKSKKPRLDSDRTVAILAYHYGYQIIDDIVNNKISAKLMLAMLDVIDQKERQNIVNLSYASRAAQIEKTSDWKNVMKEISK